MFNGSAEYATAPNGTRKRSDGALKNRWGETLVRVQFPGPVSSVVVAGLDGKPR